MGGKVVGRIWEKLAGQASRELQDSMCKVLKTTHTHRIRL